MSIEGVLKNKKAKIAYLPACFPDKNASIDAFKTLIDAGADILEIGLAYSDPVLDGQAIQNATNIVLEKGYGIKDFLDVAKAVSSYSPKTPLIAMGYLNMFYKYGYENFSKDFKASGGSGVIIADLVPENAGAWLKSAAEHGLDTIFLVCEKTPLQRIKYIASLSGGFIYALSHMGTTGARDNIDGAELVKRIRSNAPGKYICLGLGVKTASQIQEILSYCDGAIVGSALVDALSRGELKAFSSKLFA